ncbi:hypothetical protein [Desulfofalx alkaliphila]|nr:hypothetical protein [Desulfofalx alkaliphila]
MANKCGLWYPVQMLPKRKETPAKDTNKSGKWRPVQMLGPKK